MLIDSQALFSDAQTLAISATSNALSTNTIDLGAAGTNALGFSPILDPGRGVPVIVSSRIVLAPGGASSTLKAQLVMADSADLGTNLVVLTQTDDIPVATLVAGYRFRLGALPAGITKRYLGMRYVNGSGNNMTGGGVTSALVNADQDTYVG